MGGEVGGGEDSVDPGVVGGGVVDGRTFHWGTEERGWQAAL